MDKKKTFSEAVRDKLWRERGRKLDAAFWTRFNEEFGESVTRPIFRRVWAPALGLSLLALVVTSRLTRHLEPALPPEVVASTGLLEDLELFTTFKKLPITDEEWKILLPEKDG